MPKNFYKALVIIFSCFLFLQAFSAGAQDTNRPDKGPIPLIIAIFSFLVIILLIGFVGGWYVSKIAEIKRYRRILISQREIIAFYNILKNDADKALKNLSKDQIGEAKISETRFFLKQIGENLEKMNKYVVRGIKIISKYDIINKIDKHENPNC